MPDTPYEDVQIEGHLIDSLMMPHIMDEVMDLDGEFEMLTFEVGRMKDDPSHAVMRIFGRDAAHLDAWYDNEMGYATRLAETAESSWRSRGNRKLPESNQRNRRIPQVAFWKPQKDLSSQSAFK